MEVIQQFNEGTMHFTFTIIFADGQSTSLDATNLYDASRRARNLGARRLFVRNPGTGVTSELSLTMA